MKYQRAILHLRHPCKVHQKDTGDNIIFWIVNAVVMKMTKPVLER